MESRIQEAIRYLGYGRNAVDQETLDMVSEAFLQLEPMRKEAFGLPHFSVRADGG